MIAIYSIVINIIMDFKTLKIAMFINSIDKILKVVKGVWLDIIHKYVDAIYIMIDMFKAFIILVAIAAAVSSTELFTFV